MEAETHGEHSASGFKRRSQQHWAQTPCGSNYSELEYLSPAYFDEIERHRYEVYPWLLQALQELSVRDRHVLEIGFGMGTDHHVLARGGAQLIGVDLTPNNSRITRKRFALSGQSTRLLAGDGEALPLEDECVDLVYSFGVMHHSPDASRFLREVHRVLRPGGRCWIGVYHKDSIFFWWSLFFREWLLGGGFLRETLRSRVARVEFPNDDPEVLVRLYRKSELAQLFSPFSHFRVRVEHLLREDVRLFGPYLPTSWLRPLARRFGWYLVVEASK